MFQPKTERKKFFQNNSPKCLSELLNCSLSKFAKILPKFRNTFTHSRSIHIDQKFLRKVSFLKIFLNTQDTFWLLSCEIFTQVQKMFRSKSEDNLKNFPKKWFPSMCLSAEHGESSFDDFTEKFVPNVRKKFAQNLNLHQKQNKSKNPHL